MAMYEAKGTINWFLSNGQNSKAQFNSEVKDGRRNIFSNTTDLNHPVSLDDWTEFEVDLDIKGNVETVVQNGSQVIVHIIEESGTWKIKQIELGKKNEKDGK